MNSLLISIPKSNPTFPRFSFSFTNPTLFLNSINGVSFRRGGNRIGGLSFRANARSAIDEAELLESGHPNPTISSSYRPPTIPQPNQTVLEAQARVCTGPEQTRPLTEEQAFKVLDTILKSGECSYFEVAVGYFGMLLSYSYVLRSRGELKDDEVSKAQLGAFFAGMTIRANAFPEPTQWSEGERRAMDVFWPHLVEVLPQDIIFIADPEGTIMESGNSIGSNYVGEGTAEMRLVGALREVLAGGHLGYEEVQGVLRDVLPLKSDDDGSAKASESLIAAFLIGQRMNRETDRELKAYCLAFDDDLGNAFFLTLESQKIFK
ncbi:hypothetical protein BHE74_00027990 [Ensete ventricosum]|nr:hypothetical protein BHE74_00027990 [Ensete ventricosum]